MITRSLSVPGMHCDHCRSSIEGALRPLPGVREATVDLAARTVTVAYDEQQVDERSIVTAIEDQGYDVEAQGA